MLDINKQTIRTRWPEYYGSGSSAYLSERCASTALGISDIRLVDASRASIIRFQSLLVSEFRCLTGTLLLRSSSAINARTSIYLHVMLT